MRTAEDEEKDSGPDPKASDKDEEMPADTEYVTDITEDMNLTNYKVPTYKHCRQNQISVGE